MLSGQPITLSPGDLVFKADTSELLRRTRFGLVPVTGSDGDRVRLLDVANWNAPTKQFERLGVRSSNGRWIPDPDVLP
jgi:hypothetical protein